tara:strand:- start:427 stop:696 length:270 start_codon:yes stop_codon:yes gene_type:complete
MIIMIIVIHQELEDFIDLCLTADSTAACILITIGIIMIPFIAGQVFTMDTIGILHFIHITATPLFITIIIHLTITEIILRQANMDIINI